MTEIQQKWEEWVKSELKKWGQCGQSSRHQILVKPHPGVVAFDLNIESLEGQRWAINVAEYLPKKQERLGMVSHQSHISPHKLSGDATGAWGNSPQNIYSPSSHRPPPQKKYKCVKNKQTIWWFQHKKWQIFQLFCPPKTFSCPLFPPPKKKKK